MNRPVRTRTPVHETTLWTSWRTLGSDNGSVFRRPWARHSEPSAQALPAWAPSPRPPAQAGGAELGRASQAARGPCTGFGEQTQGDASLCGPPLAARDTGLEGSALSANTACCSAAGRLQRTLPCPTQPRGRQATPAPPATPGTFPPHVPQLPNSKPTALALHAGRKTRMPPRGGRGGQLHNLCFLATEAHRHRSRSLL